MKIAFIPHSTISAGLNVSTEKTLTRLIFATNALDAVYHRADSCNCGECTAFHHVVITDPKMDLRELKSKYANSFAQGPNFWVL